MSRRVAHGFVAALVFLCVVAQPAAAQSGREEAAPESPAGIEYALPLERARELSNPGVGRPGPGAVDAVAPLFGAGVEPARGATGERRARPVGGGEAADPAAASRSPTESGDRDAMPRGGERSTSRLPLAVAIAVLAIGALLGVLVARARRRRPVAVLAVVLAAGCATAPFWHGLYPISAWGPVGLVLAVALVALAAGRRLEPPPWPGLLALGGLALLWLWSALSVGWAESAGQAQIEAGRWLLYALALAVLLAVVRDDRLARLTIGVAAAGVAVFAGYLSVRLLLPDADSLFLGGRLDDPLGYVNGQAAYLMLAFWPALAVAEASRRPAVAGAALGVATLVCGLAVLSQARAVALATLLSAALLLAIVPGRRRRLACLAVLGIGVALAAGPLLDVYGATSPGARAVDEGRLRAAILALIAVALAVGCAWGALPRLVACAPTPLRAGLRRAALPALALACVAAGVAVVATVGDPVDQARAGAREFKALDADAARESESRFASAGGNRYDYWRIALDQFAASPAKGLGAGNYDVTYFAERRTTEDVRQPHSLPLQALAELGAVGLIAVVLFAAGPLAALARRARGDSRERALAIAAGGTFAVWLAHTSVDWLHLLPGVTGIALCAVAALVAPSGRTRGADGHGRRAYSAACVTAAVVGAGLVAGPLLADRHRDDGQRLLASDPTAALDEADAALSLDDESLEAYRLRAAASARLGSYASARTSLLEAVAREPRDFVTWALLGDLARRRGARTDARRAYARASALNPRDRALAALARGEWDAQPRVTTAN